MERRVQLVALLLLGWSAIVMVRFFSLQWEGDSMLSLQSQRQYRQELNLRGVRGTLYDRNRRELALSSRPGQRVYPCGQLAAHVLGFTGKDGRGLEGIEYLYDSLLSGKSRRVAAGRDARGKKFYLLEEPWRPEEMDGRELVLTLDEAIQHIVEKELAAQMERSRARGGIAIAMEPFSGEVLAMAVRPGFDPLRYQEGDRQIWRNRAIADSFEPGSTFKAVVLSAALQEGLASPEEQIYCEEGTLALGTGIAAIHDPHPHGWLSLEDVFAYSSNIGTVKVARRLGKALLHRYIRLFGFGSRTGIELPGEARGLVRSLEGWSRVSLEAIAIGQEIGVTPIQLVTAYAAIANGGSLLKPRIVRTLGPQNRLKRAVIRRILSPESSRKATEIPIQVVAHGTGIQASLEGFEVAGKTGTAQKFDPQRKGYSPGKYLSSFIGFVPARKPRIVLLVVIDEPRGEVRGGVVAAPVFREIARQVLRYLDRTGISVGDAEGIVAKKIFR